MDSFIGLSHAEQSELELSNIGSSVVTSIPFWVGDIDSGRGLQVCRQGVYGKSLYHPLKDAVNLKPL